MDNKAPAVWLPRDDIVQAVLGDLVEHLVQLFRERNQNTSARTSSLGRSVLLAEDGIVVVIDVVVFDVHLAVCVVQVRIFVVVAARAGRVCRALHKHLRDHALFKGSPICSRHGEDILVSPCGVTVGNSLSVVVRCEGFIVVGLPERRIVSGWRGPSQD